MKTIIKRIEEDTRNISIDMIKNKNTEVKKLHVELELNPFGHVLLSETKKYVIFKGKEEAFLNSLGLIECKRREAKYLCFIGEKEGGMFLKNKTVKLWLKSVQ